MIFTHGSNCTRSSHLKKLRTTGKVYDMDLCDDEGDRAKFVDSYSTSEEISCSCCCQGVETRWLHLISDEEVHRCYAT